MSFEPLSPSPLYQLCALFVFVSFLEFKWIEVSPLHKLDSHEAQSGWSPRTLGLHSSSPRPPIGTRSEPKLYRRRELSNAMSHSRSTRQEQVDSRLCQTASLTSGLSFAHNLGYKCPNDQCKAIFDIYVSRPFQWHQERFNARCFGPCCRTLNIRESRRTPNPQLFQVLGFTPTLGQSGVATLVRLDQTFRVWWSWVGIINYTKRIVLVPIEIHTKPVSNNNYLSWLPTDYH